jgi:hypothetical protein
MSKVYLSWLRKHNGSSESKHVLTICICCYLSLDAPIDSFPLIFPIRLNTTVHGKYSKYLLIKTFPLDGKNQEAIGQEC